VTTGSDAAKPANTVNLNPKPQPQKPFHEGKSKSKNRKPANENAVTTGFGVEFERLRT